MNRIIFPVLFAAGALLWTSCAQEKENPYSDEQLPEVTVTTDMSTFLFDEAELQFTLSHYIHKDVVVTFQTDGIASEAVKLPSSFTIPAGTVKRTLTVGIDETVPAPGNYDVKIALATVENGVAGSASSVTLSEQVYDVARVSLTGTDFQDDAAAVRVNLHKALTQPATLKLSVVAAGTHRYPLIPASAVTMTQEVTIPAGERTVSVPVTLRPAGLSYGRNELKVSVATKSGNLTYDEVPAVLGYRAPIVLKERTDWRWGYDADSGKFYTYDTGLSGIANVAVLTVSKPANVTAEYLEEQIYQFATALDKEDAYSTAGWRNNYIWLKEETFKPGTYLGILVGLDDNLSPTGDYAVTEIVKEAEGAEDTIQYTRNTKWSFVYYSGWYYVYTTGVKFGMWTVPGDLDVTNASTIKTILLTYQTQLKANTSGSLVWNSGISEKDYSVFELSAAAYTSAPSYSFSSDVYSYSSDGKYYAFMIGLDDKGNITGEYQYLDFTWE